MKIDLSVLKDHSFIKQLPSCPGVYRMYDGQGVLLYVGKAVSLKSRLSSYFKSNISGKTRALVNKISAIEITITANETQALLLESNLIKQFHPRYNIVLRDDKSYPYILITQDEFPRVTLYRTKKLNKNKGEFFGPYPSVLAVKEVLTLLQRVFKIRTCTNSYFHNRKRPCLQYQIKRCSAPCVAYIEKLNYQLAINKIRLFLSGRSEELMASLEEDMNKAVDALLYEKAAVLRDQIQALQKVRELQFVTMQGGEADVLACKVEAATACVVRLCIREGKILHSESFFPKLPKEHSTLNETEKDVLNSEILAAFISQYYLDGQKSLPQELILFDLKEKSVIEQALHQLNNTVKLTIKPRGKKAKWQALAEHNANSALNHFLQSKSNVEQRFQELEKALAVQINRIECFDISHMMGEKTVASCVVFDRAGPATSLYRQFNIKNITAGDDYAAMHQALERRYKGQVEKGEGLPDLLLIDGGKGQLNQAKNVLTSLGIDSVMIIGVAKGITRRSGDETLLLPDSFEELNLPEHSKARHLIQQVRDEAHRFAIQRHRKQRDKSRKLSLLESIEGVGAKRRQILLRRFGGIRNLKNASVEDIATVRGISKKLAQLIFQHLKDN